MEVLQLGVAVMEHFMKGSAQLWLWYVNSEENICYSSHLGFLQENVPLWHLLNDETLFVS